MRPTVYALLRRNTHSEEIVEIADDNRQPAASYIRIAYLSSPGAYRSADSSHRFRLVGTSLI